MSTLGSRIKDARKKRGLTQSDLASLVKVKSSAVISNWEKDLNKPDAEKIVLLCKTLDVPASYLLGSNPSDDLSVREKTLIEKFREISEEAKERIESAIDLEYRQLAEKARAEAKKLA